MGKAKDVSIACSAGNWTRVIFDFGKGYPESREIVLQSRHSDLIEAEYRETHYDWIFPKQPVLGKIHTSATFNRRWIDGIYSVYIKPEIDCIAIIN